MVNRSKKCLCKPHQIFPSNESIVGASLYVRVKKLIFQNHSKFDKYQFSLHHPITLVSQKIMYLLPILSLLFFSKISSI